jgi:hypothetical protein
VTLHYDIAGSQRRWDAQIRRFGGLAYLRTPSTGAQRSVMYMPANFTAMERLGGISNPADRKAVVSALDPSGAQLAPDPSELEVLVALVLANGVPVVGAGGVPQVRELLKQFAPPRPVGPLRDTPLYWVLSVRA